VNVNESGDTVLVNLLVRTVEKLKIKNCIAERKKLETVFAVVKTLEARVAPLGFLWKKRVAKVPATSQVKFSCKYLKSLTVIIIIGSGLLSFRVYFF
jgi:hypothetical protein